MDGKKEPTLKKISYAPNKKNLSEGTNKEVLGLADSNYIAIKKSKPRKNARRFSMPTRKKKIPTRTQLIRLESEPLVTRIHHEPSYLKKTWRVLTDIFEPPNVVQEEESFIYHLQSFIVYVLHFFLVLWVVYAGCFDVKYNYSTIILSDLITKSYFESELVPKSLNFDGIRAPRQIWEFTRGVILKIIYPIEATNSTHNSIWQNNIMVGVAQIRQVRVKKDTCDSAPAFNWLYKHCYGYFEEDEDKQPFGPNTSTSWRYSYDPEKSVSGFFNQYSGNGFAMNFSQDYNMTVLKMSELENNQWIGQGTRAVFLDFTTYCQNTNVFHIVNLVFEMMPWGGVYPTSNIYAVTLRPSFYTAQQFVLLAFNIVLLGYTLGLNYAIYLRFKREGMKFLNAANEIAIISSTYIVLGVHLTVIVISHQRLPRLIEMINTSQHPTFGVFTRIYEVYSRVAAVLLFCMVIKFFTYGYYFNHHGAYTVCAFKKVKKKMLCFTLMNLSVLIGFSFLLPALVGQMFESVRTPVQALIHTIFWHVKSFDGRTGTYKRTVAGPGFFLAHVSFPLFFIYINCISVQTYVALMVHGWQRAAVECVRDTSQRLTITALEFTWSRIEQILENCRLHGLAKKLHEWYIIRMNKEDFYPITEILRRYGWKPLEIRLLLEKHGIHKGDDLTVDEIFKVYQDFWVRNSLFFEVAGHEELKSDTKKIQRHIEYCESTIAALKSKIERLADIVIEQRKSDPTPPRSSIATGSNRSMISRIMRP